MAAADGRQSSGDQSEAAAELIANTSHHGLTKQTSQPVSASQQDTGGLYTNGSAGVGARSSTGAQKALTMEDLQVCSRHNSSGQVLWLVQWQAASSVCSRPLTSIAWCIQKEEQHTGGELVGMSMCRQHIVQRAAGTMKS